MKLHAPCNLITMCTGLCLLAAATDALAQPRMLRVISDRIDQGTLRPLLPADAFSRVPMRC